MSQQTPQPTFVELWPAIKRVARWRFRKRRDLEERMAECTAHAFFGYTRMIAAGKMPNPSTLADFACRRVNSGRRFATAPGRSIEGIHGQRRDIRQVDVELNDYVSHKISPADQAAYRIDTAAWLASLSPSLRKTADLLIAAGPDAKRDEIAKELGVSPARVSQRRRELLESWMIFTS